MIRLVSLMLGHGSVGEGRLFGVSQIRQSVSESDDTRMKRRRTRSGWQIEQYDQIVRINRLAWSRGIHRFHH